MKHLTFEEILRSEFYYLVEAIEHGSSDKSLIDSYKEELFQKTRYKWID